jgi:hypothetical protein
MSLFPLIIYAHYSWSFGFHEDFSPLFSSLAQTYSFYLLGLFFYSSRFPERFWPGKFDIWVSDLSNAVLLYSFVSCSLTLIKFGIASRCIHLGVGFLVSQNL